MARMPSGGALRRRGTTGAPTGAARGRLRAATLWCATRHGEDLEPWLLPWRGVDGSVSPLLKRRCATTDP